MLRSDALQVINKIEASHHQLIFKVRNLVIQVKEAPKVITMVEGIKEEVVCMEVNNRITCKVVCLHLPRLIIMETQFLDMECHRISMDHQVSQDMQVECKVLLKTCIMVHHHLIRIHHTGLLPHTVNHNSGEWECHLTYSLSQALAQTIILELLRKDSLEGRELHYRINHLTIKEAIQLQINKLKTQLYKIYLLCQVEYNLLKIIQLLSLFSKCPMQ